MVRNPIAKEDPQPEPVEQAAPEQPAQPVQVIEREVTLSLLNDKLNYLTGVIHKIAEAAEIKLE